MHVGNYTKKCAFKELHTKFVIPYNHVFLQTKIKKFL